VVESAVRRIRARGRGDDARALACAATALVEGIERDVVMYNVMKRETQ